MTTPVLASAALKTIFEENPDSLKELGLEEAILGPIMSYLAKTYADAAEFELAVKAAQVMANPDDYRMVFLAMKSATAAATHYKGHHLQNDYVFLLMQIGTEAELREQAQHGKDLVAISILRQLKDAAGLVILGRKLEDKYFGPKPEKQLFELSPKIIVGDIVSAYKAAAELGDERMTQELMRFGDKLKEHDGVCADYVSHSINGQGYNGQRLPLAEAYEASGVTAGFIKAATVYIELSEHKVTHREKNHYLMCAAEAFIKAGDFDQAQAIASQLVVREATALAIRIALKTPQGVGFALLEQYALAAIQEATELVKKSVLDYLDTYDTQLPFFTDYTYWSDSLGNNAWPSCVNNVNYMTGRFDESSIRVRRNSYGKNSIARHLYTSDKAEVIKKTNGALIRHLFVGWMLSGISYEQEFGSHGAGRKYHHPCYAAWRTFDEIGLQERKVNLGLPSDELVLELYTYLEGIFKEWSELLSGQNCSRESEAFLSGKLAEMGIRSKQVYSAVSNDVKELVAQL